MTQGVLWAAASVAGLGGLFVYTNGAKDGANVVATMISTRVLDPGWALWLASVGEVLGAALLGVAVARMIGTEIVKPGVLGGVTGSGGTLGVAVVAAAVSGALVWNVFTWVVGIPSSSSHALLGGLLGAVLPTAGVGAVRWAAMGKVLAVLFVSPVVGLVAGYGLARVLLWAGQWATPRAGQVLKPVQVAAAFGLAVSHGTNDAQKTMGMVLLALISLGVVPRDPAGGWMVPGWLVWMCALGMGLGVGTGGRRLVRTLGTGIFRLRLLHGFSAQATAALVVLASSLCGFPVSTTEVVTASIAGTGSAARARGVRWGVLRHAVTAWVVTIPATAAAGALGMALLRHVVQA